MKEVAIKHCLAPRVILGTNQLAKTKAVNFEKVTETISDEDAIKLCYQAGALLIFTSNQAKFKILESKDIHEKMSLVHQALEDEIEIIRKNNKRNKSRLKEAISGKP